MATEITRAQLIAKVFELRSQGYSFKAIDSVLEADKGLLEGCSYRDFSYRVTKTSEYQALVKNSK